MNIQQKIDESQKRTQLTNMVNIDWQYAVQIIPLVLPLIVKEQTTYNEIKNECKILYDLFSNIENNIKELKDMIPTE
jgi:hypothetical protein